MATETGKDFLLEVPKGKTLSNAVRRSFYKFMTLFPGWQEECQCKVLDTQSLLVVFTAYGAMEANLAYDIAKGGEVYTTDYVLAMEELKRGYAPVQKEVEETTPPKIMKFTTKTTDNTRVDNESEDGVRDRGSGVQHHESSGSVEGKP